MSEFLLKLKNYLFYGGHTRDEFMSIRNKVWESNRKNMVIYSLIMIIGMLTLFILSWFDNFSILASSRLLYMVCLDTGIVFFIISLFFAKKHIFLSPLCSYLLSILLLAFGILLGTVVEPNQASASFGILMFAIPLLFTDVPVITDCLLLIGMVVYIIVAKITQSAEMYAFNLSFVLPYGVVGLILCAIAMSSKVTSILRDEQNKTLSERDQLTGLYNRRCYDKALQQFHSQTDDVYVVLYSFDANGLKLINDSLGHNAGDELIIGTAQCLLKTFGKFGKCYRTGGDEFFAIITDKNVDLTKLEKEFDKLCASFNGMFITSISVSYGKSICANKDMVKNAVLIADQEMYASKNAYYNR